MNPTAGIYKVMAKLLSSARLKKRVINGDVACCGGQNACFQAGRNGFDGIGCDDRRRVEGI